MSGYIARRYELVTPSDSADLPGGLCYGLLVGTAGAASLVDGDGVRRDNVPLQAGFNPIQARRVRATGTAAANIFALY